MFFLSGLFKMQNFFFADIEAFLDLYLRGRVMLKKTSIEFSAGCLLI